ncbi:hypothetical protein MSAN_01915500 [Mycena sanguinolenta]|uniref:Transposase n=1 Tax=Mycena sanguinolenta TaxID=230812 RepID=A0A8H6XQ74_9AGAR|nr:hypothetical protein MSAN_01915500 [Mycena sanguinolenta]
MRLLFSSSHFTTRTPLAYPTESRLPAKTKRGIPGGRIFGDFPAKSEAGKVFGACQTQFEQFLKEQVDAGHQPWHPFQSKAEWELARWLMTSGVSQSKRDEFLELETIREGCKPSFTNNYAFLKFIDALPRGPAWDCHLMELTGDEVDEKGEKKKETVELWYRDPVECVRELLGNPAFRGKQSFAPRRVFRREGGQNREYSEMWTARWWWEIQKLLPAGATLGSIIISSDKTQLTRFSGDQQAWPVYITVGNIDMETRRAPSSHATILLGYIPVTKLEIFEKKRRSGIAHQLFHNCMAHILEPLKAAGTEGVWMDCADGFVRRVFPILAAYIADYPEQCLVACCRENSCPRCLVAPAARGDTTDAPWRNPTDTVRIISEQAHGTRPPEFIAQNLRPIVPFWADLPHCDIFTCFTPDLLHELHNGVFGDHLVSWCSNAFPDGTGETEIDSRFRAMTPHSSLRHFKKGISLTSQWTGNEHKNMEKVFLGIIANTTSPAVQRAAKGALDFIYYAHFEVHCDESLSKMDAAWAAFHENKHIFIDSGIRQNFDINKLHKLKHYTDAIRSRGAAPGFNTENTERLHIDLAKVGYKATNKKAYIKQMTTWLRRQESVYQFDAFLSWAVPGYMSQRVPDTEIETEEAEDAKDETENDDDAENVAPISVYSLPKTAHFPNLSASSIATDFCAPDFLPKLADFLDSNSVQVPVQPTAASLFPVYKHVRFTLPVVPEVTRHPVQDKVRAVKREPMKIISAGRKPPKSAQFDTVLVRTQERTNGGSPIDGLRVARMRVIFRLPEGYGNYADPLAYVDWFRPLTRPVPDLGMYQVSLSTRMHRQHSEIIPITQIPPH